MRPAAEPRLRLLHKLAAAVLLLAALLLAALLGFVGPRTTADFRAASDTLLDRSRAAMRELTLAHAQQSRQLLVDLLAETTEARRRTLADLPFDLFRDIEQVRAHVLQDDQARQQRLRRNLDVLAAELQRRSDARIDQELADLEQQQQALAGTFADAVRRTHFWLCAVLLAAALLLLGLGLHHLVVRPVARLRQATRRIADGELSTPVRCGGGDEVGALAVDFDRMVVRLRQSQQALSDLNRELEHRVDQQARALAQAEKLASLGTLAGGIAHEFNNLIGGIRGCAGEVHAGEPDAGRRETLDVILRATDRAAAIVAQLRSFARREPPRARDCRLDEVVADALRLIEPEARRRRVEVERHLTALPFHGDDGALHQVFVNLLTNALQAMPDGGRLTVTARLAGAEAMVSVADTGVGIAKEDRDRVFEPFFTRRADDADPAQRGTGLGLSVSYGIVDAHGGSIAVASTPGQGTTFTVRLPARRG